jgi:hypothetical protein
MRTQSKQKFVLQDKDLPRIRLHRQLGYAWDRIAMRFGVPIKAFREAMRAKGWSDLE